MLFQFPYFTPVKHHFQARSKHFIFSWWGKGIYFCDPQDSQKGQNLLLANCIWLGPQDKLIWKLPIQEILPEKHKCFPWSLNTIFKFHLTPALPAAPSAHHYFSCPPLPPAHSLTQLYQYLKTLKKKKRDKKATLQFSKWLFHKYLSNTYLLKLKPLIGTVWTQPLVFQKSLLSFEFKRIVKLNKNIWYIHLMIICID